MRRQYSKTIFFLKFESANKPLLQTEKIKPQISVISNIIGDKGEASQLNRNAKAIENFGLCSLKWVNMDKNRFSSISKTS